MPSGHHVGLHYVIIVGKEAVDTWLAVRVGPVVPVKGYDKTS